MRLWDFDAERLWDLDRETETERLCAWETVILTVWDWASLRVKNCVTERLWDCETLSPSAWDWLRLRDGDRESRDWKTEALKVRLWYWDSETMRLRNSETERLWDWDWVAETEKLCDSETDADRLRLKDLDRATERLLKEWETERLKLGDSECETET